MPTVKNVGEPCAGEPHARIEEAAGGNQASRASTGRAAQAPLADPTATRRGRDACVAMNAGALRCASLAAGVPQKQQRARRGWSLLLTSLRCLQLARLLAPVPADPTVLLPAGTESRDVSTDHGSSPITDPIAHPDAARSREMTVSRSAIRSTQRAGCSGACYGTGVVIVVGVGVFCVPDGVVVLVVGVAGVVVLVVVVVGAVLLTVVVGGVVVTVDVGLDFFIPFAEPPKNVVGWPFPVMERPAS